MKVPCIPHFEKLKQLARVTPGLDLDAVTACVPLLYLHRELDAALEQHYEAYGLSRGRWQLLMQLYKAAPPEGLTPAALAELTGVTRAAITGLVDSLAEAGLVARGEVGEDRRTYRVQLTPEGNAFLASVLPDHMQRMQRLMQALTPDERQTFVDLVEKLRARVEVFRHAPAEAA
jgi:DNA-binding MarR family transcriptional regulator